MIGGLSFGMVSFLSPMEVVVVACAKLAAAAELLEVIGHTSNFSHRGGYQIGARASNLGFQMEAYHKPLRAYLVSKLSVRPCVCVRMLYARNC